MGRKKTAVGLTLSHKRERVRRRWSSFVPGGTWVGWGSAPTDKSVGCFLSPASLRSELPPTLISCGGTSRPGKLGWGVDRRRFVAMAEP